jgi:hypothetical protein
LALWPVAAYVEKSEPIALATPAASQPQHASTFVKVWRSVEQLFR